MDLGPGKTHGEFALIRMLADSPETAPLAVAAAAGWRGDRVIEAGDCTAWIVAFTAEENARALPGGAGQIADRPEARPEQLPGRARCFRLARAQGGSRRRAGAARASWSLEAPDEAAYRSLLDRVEGPLTLHVQSTRDKRAVSFGKMIDRLLEADLICIDETHDSDLNHRVQLQIVKALFARDERLGVGMEMFQRPFQKEIDRYFRGEIGEEEFLKATEYRQRWGFEWSLYRPIVEFCRKNGVPLAALNAPRELTRRISAVGFAGLNDDEKNQLGPVDFQVKEHRDYWYERLAQMHGKADVPEEQKERSYQVMTIWDEYMGASAARFQMTRPVRRMVILAGSGHIERGFGIPARAAKRTGGKVVTVGIAVGAEEKKGDAVTDFVVTVK